MKYGLHHVELLFQIMSSFSIYDIKREFMHAYTLLNIREIIRIRSVALGGNVFTPVVQNSVVSSAEIVFSGQKVNYDEYKSLGN